MSPKREIGSRKLLRAMGILKRKRYPCSLYCLCSGPGNSIIYLADNQKRAWFFWLPRACHPLLQWCVGKNLPGITSRLLWPVRELFDCLWNDLSLRQRESKQVSKTGPGKEYFKTSSQILRELLKDGSVSWRLKHLAEKSVAASAWSQESRPGSVNSNEPSWTRKGSKSLMPRHSW